MDDKELEELCFTAQRAREHSYSPYSGYEVGCALLLENHDVVIGANIENSIFGLTECAERVAIFNWLTGSTKHFDIKHLVYASDSVQHSSPCGACLQVMMEFMDPETFVTHFSSRTATSKTWRLKELLPHSTVIRELDKSNPID